MAAEARIQRHDRVDLEHKEAKKERRKGEGEEEGEGPTTAAATPDRGGGKVGARRGLGLWVHGLVASGVALGERDHLYYNSQCRGATAHGN